MSHIRSSPLACICVRPKMCTQHANSHYRWRVHMLPLLYGCHARHIPRYPTEVCFFHCLRACAAWRVYREAAARYVDSKPPTPLLHALVGVGVWRARSVQGGCALHCSSDWCWYQGVQVECIIGGHYYNADLLAWVCGVHVQCKAGRCSTAPLAGVDIKVCTSSA